MNAAMGFDGEGPLPQQVDALVAATGVAIASPSPAVARFLGGLGGLGVDRLRFLASARDFLSLIS